MMEQEQISDPNTWPSRYYGRTRHVDIEQLYNQLLNNMTLTTTTITEEEQSNNNNNNNNVPRRSVSFSTAAPIIYEYEPEFEQDQEQPPPAYEEPATAYVSLDDSECSTTVYATPRRKKKSAALRKLDLRPVVNHEYNKNAEEDDKQSVTSSECSLPPTPPDIYPSSSLPTSHQQHQPLLYTPKPEVSQSTDSIISRSSLLFRIRTSPLFNQRRKTAI